MQHLTHRFALTRRPGFSFAEGITTAGLGAPDLGKARAQHAAYVQALQDNGLEVTVLEADERYPDGCFVEDTAVVLPEIAIVACPGADSRRGEPEAIAAVLANHRPLVYLSDRDSRARLDGGDVLRIEQRLYVGRSARTNADGIAALAAIVEPLGYRVHAMPVDHVLHLKTGVTYAGKRILVADEHFCTQPVFQDFEKIRVPRGEAYAANILKINDAIILPEGFPFVRDQLLACGLNISKTLKMSEFQKMDGGLTCLSVLF